MDVRHKKKYIVFGLKSDFYDQLCFSEYGQGETSPIFIIPEACTCMFVFSNFPSECYFILNKQSGNKGDVFSF